MVSATAPPFIAPISAKNTSATATRAPAKLPSHTRDQFFRMCPHETVPVPSAPIIMMLPVNSSDPQHTTSTRPKQKLTPPRTRETANGRLASEVTRQKNSAPNAM